MPDYEAMKKYFVNDIYATQTTGIKIEEISDNHAICSLKIEERHLNANNTIMGGAVFTLADFAFALAANTRNMDSVSLNTNVIYCNAARLGETLYAEATCVKYGRSTNTFIVYVKNEAGKQIAVATINGFRKAQN